MTDTWTATISADVWQSNTTPGVMFEVVVADPDASGGGVADHGALTGLGDDDHPQYQLVSAKNQPNGYPGLDGDGTIPDNRIPSSIARDTEVTAAVSSLSTVYQPLDSDLTAIAALSTTTFGRSLLALADAAAGRTALGLGTAATAASGDFQPVDSDLTAIATLTTTSFGRSLLEQASASAARATLGVGLVVGGQDVGPRVEDTASETRILDGTITLPALAPSELLLFRGAFQWLNNSGAIRTLTLRVKVGSTTLLTAVSGTLGSNATARNGRIEGYIRANASGDADGEMNVVVTNASDPTNSLGTEMTVNGTMTEAIQTAGLAFDLTAQLATSNATQWVELQSFAIWKVAA